MSDFFQETPLTLPEPAKQVGEIGRGPDWYVVKEKERYVLHYLTGASFERGNQIEVMRTEAEDVISGHQKVKDVLALYGR